MRITQAQFKAVNKFNKQFTEAVVKQISEITRVELSVKKPEPTLREKASEDIKMIKAKLREQAKKEFF